MKRPVDWSNVIDRTFAVSAAVTVTHITFGSSTVGLNLWILDGTLARIAAVIYVAVLVALVARPSRESLHTAAAVAGVAFWMGRMGAFLQLALGGQSNLWSAVNERALLVVIVVLWHLRAVRAAVVRVNYARLRSEIK